MHASKAAINVHVLVCTEIRRGQWSRIQSLRVYIVQASELYIEATIAVVRKGDAVGHMLAVVCNHLTSINDIHSN